MHAKTLFPKRVHILQTNTSAWCLSTYTSAFAAVFLLSQTLLYIFEDLKRVQFLQMVARVPGNRLL
jgi:hypothetical protein